ncbi:MAG: hypothetical protein ABI634_18620, partial [Acidobacteriota bacterium]
AKFLQNNLINRRGVLKNALRRDLPYRMAKSTADTMFRAAGLTVFRAGRAYFRSRVQPLSKASRPSVPA